MSEALSTTSLKALLRFPFQGKEWQSRFVVGAALTLAGFFIPLLPFLPVLGYLVPIWRQAIKGEDPSLPAWDNWGRLVTDGLRLFAVDLVFFLPGGLILAAGTAQYFAASVYLPIASEAGGDGGGLALVFVASIGIFFLSLALGSLLLLLAAIPAPVATAHFVARDQVAAAFRVREWWPILWKNKLGYFLAWVIALGLLSVARLVYEVAYYSVVLCCLIPVLLAPIYFYLALVGAGLYGQTYRESVANLASSAP